MEAKAHHLEEQPHEDVEDNLPEEPEEEDDPLLDGDDEEDTAADEDEAEREGDVLEELPDLVAGGVVALLLRGRRRR